MDMEKQRLMLSLVASNRELMALTVGIMQPSYFDPSLKKTVKFMIDYFNKYKDVPKLTTIRAEVGTVFEDSGKIEKSDISYVANEMETFCRNRAVTEAILAGPELLEKQDFGKIIDTLKNAISVGLQKDIGIDYFEDPESRLKRTYETEHRISTGIQELDDGLGGGIGRQELLLFAAGSGVGKSMTMLNIARNLLSQGLNGVYISLEMAEGVVSKRLDSMISNISQGQLLKEMQKVANAIEKAENNGMGKFLIKRMPEQRTNVNHVRSYIQQLEQSKGFVPDFIVIDYIDIMGTTHAVSLENLFVKDKYVTEEVRALGFDFDAIMISASQLGRGAIDAEKLNQGHIQGGMSKVNTTDNLVFIRQDDMMKASGQISFEILKSRNSSGTGRKMILDWDPISLVIKSPTNKLQLQNKQSKILETGGTMFGNKKKEDGILSLMNIDD